MRLTLIFLMIITLLISCADKEIVSSEIYVGTYRIGDRMIPYPFIIKKEKDSLYLFNNSGICIDKIFQNLLKKDKVINFKEKHFKILDQKDDYLVVFDLQDTANFIFYKNGKPNLKYAAKFLKLEKENKLNLQKLKKEISNSIWKYDYIEDDNSNRNLDLEIEKLFHFKDDSVSVITNYFYQDLKVISEYETKLYHIYEIEDIYFLSLQKEGDNPQPIYRITGFDSKKIDLLDYSSREQKNLSFHKASIKIDAFKEQLKKTSAYANCYDGYQGEYSYEDVTFKKGNKYIANYVSKNLPPTETKSGYIIIHFNINCNGDIGNFGLIQMDKEYKEAAFSKEIVNHLIKRVSELKDFPSSESAREWLYFEDVHAFLMFKLDRGKITDVCP